MRYRLRLIGIVFALLVSGFLLEPALRQKVTFAVSYFDSSRVTYKNNPAFNISENNQPTPKQHKTHAPEPSTIALFLSGLGGLIIRFARKSFERFKRYLDIFLAMAGLAMAFPVFVIVTALTKMTSKGPVIYRQDRVGQNGEVFKIYKFRTMCVDAEKTTGAVWATKNDSRVTALGRILRKTHIDEIPQFLNVLKGEMSIVGPRPERPELVRDLRELIRDYEKRLEVKPGITGLAQVWNRYDENIEDVKKKVKYDCLYIKRMCLPVDLQIMANTFVVALTGKGAR